MSAGQKTPFAQTINRFVEKKIEDFQDTLGQILPCTVVSVDGSIVTVRFEVLSGVLTLPQVTMPIAESQYTRLPIQPGDKGICLAADARLGGITGLGVDNSLAPLGPPGSLGGLVFLPISNKKWFSVNGRYLFLYGPDGVEITTENQDCKLTLNASGITIDLNGGNMNVNNGNVTMQGNLTVDGSITGLNGMSITGTAINNGVNIGSTHTHPGVQSGPSSTGTPQ